MATNFDRWEKDPFFSAAEEVQESADRMESTYRTWLHDSKDCSSATDPEELRRDLHTTLGTAKWQLDEFDRAVRSSYVDSSAKDARTRHQQFIIAIGEQILTVENALKESVHAKGKVTLPWVRLDEGERDELALFLSGSRDGDRRTPTMVSKNKDGEEDSQEIHGIIVPECPKDSCRSVEMDQQEKKDERLHGHRRTASAADIGAWKIAVAEEDLHKNSLNAQPDQPLPRIVSFSGLINTMELRTKVKWPKNGFRKWRNGDCHQASDAVPLRPNQLDRGSDSCYERNKSCLDNCDDSYDKQLYGWLGVVRRQLQRSLYHVQYGRPVRVACWIVLVLCLIVLFVLRSI